jgi:phytanoyl-CoA hydroxylase
MGVTAEERDFFTENGFLVKRALFAPEEVETLRRRAEAIATGEVQIPQGEVAGGRATGVSRRKPGVTSPPPELPEIRITPRHARRGYQIYPTRQRPVDEAAVQASLTSGEPFADVLGMNHLADHDEVFRAFAAHSNIVAVLQDLIGPHVKLFFDHLFYKGPYGPANRYHQDGFFEFSDRSVTCWVALDDVTTENGCMRYIPETLGYGQFRFDQLGEAITARELEAEVLVPLRPGDAVFHDRWTLHGTGPNDTPRGRRAWAVHYTSAKSRFVYDPTFTATSYVQTPDGRHLRDEVIDGNRYYRLVCGREFPGCV